MVIIQGAKPFAVLLCNFTDSPNPQPFTVAEAQSGWDTNEKFWEATSYGIVSLEGSVVYDWITLPVTNGAFVTKARSDMIQYAKDQSGIDQSKFVGFIVIFSEPVGTAWTAGTGSVFEPSIVRSTYVCHEMTHILGEPTHSFDLSGRKDADWSAPGEYFDQTDIMSAENCWGTAPALGDIFSGAGPFHCMVWKDQFGWLVSTEVRRITDEELESPFNETITLETRDFLSGQGLACIFFRDMSIEFAIPRSFDAGLPSEGILIHQNVSGVPYVVVPDVANNPDQKFWFAGDVCSRLATGVDAGEDIYIWISSIDGPSGTAKINISNGPISPLQAVQILAIRKAHSTAGGGFEYIDFVGISDGKGGLIPISRSTVVEYIETGRNRFFVVGGDGSSADVEVESHYIKTAPDGSKEDNLLSLPSF